MKHWCQRHLLSPSPNYSDSEAMFPRDWGGHGRPESEVSASNSIPWIIYIQRQIWNSSPQLLSPVRLLILPVTRRGERAVLAAAHQCFPQLFSSRSWLDSDLECCRWVCWDTPVIPTLGNLRWDWESKASLDSKNLCRPNQPTIKDRTS